jgi:GT2 family glycosyltransferase
MISFCIPTLNQPELLKGLVESIYKGSLQPDKIFVINNGNANLNFLGNKVGKYKPGTNLGVAASWNYFIKNTDGIRIISNDDLVLYPDTLENFISGYKEGKLNCILNSGINAFSFFGIDNSVIDKVGLFDESISPNYAYFEDNDYSYRMSLLGVEFNKINCKINHVGSATIKKFNQAEMSLHHKKFNLARQNYIKKWGGEPGKEIYKTPYNH